MIMAFSMHKFLGSVEFEMIKGKIFFGKLWFFGKNIKFSNKHFYVDWQYFNFIKNVLIK